MKKQSIIAAGGLLILSMAACTGNATRGTTPMYTPTPAMNTNRAATTAAPTPSASTAPRGSVTTAPRGYNRAVPGGRHNYPSAMTTPGGFGYPRNMTPENTLPGTGTYNDNARGAYDGFNDGVREGTDRTRSSDYGTRGTDRTRSSDYGTRGTNRTHRTNRTHVPNRANAMPRMSPRPIR